MSAEECALRITERIWLRAFGTPPKFPLGELQIRSGRYVNIFIASVSLSSLMYLEITLLQLPFRKLLQARIHLIQHPPYRFRAHKFYESAALQIFHTSPLRVSASPSQCSESSFLSSLSILTGYLCLRFLYCVFSSAVIQKVLKSSASATGIAS